MSRFFFSSLAGSSEAQLHEVRADVNTALGQQSSVLGRVYVNLALNGVDVSGSSASVHLYVPVYVIDNLHQNFIFGNDLLSRHEQLSSNSHAYFSTDKADLENLSPGTTIFQLTEHCVRIPIMKAAGFLAPVHTEGVIKIPPNKPLAARGLIKPGLRLPNWIDHPVKFAPVSNLPQGLVLPETSHVFTGDVFCPVSLWNTTNKTIVLPHATHLGYLSPLAVSVTATDVTVTDTQDWTPSSNDGVQYLKKLLAARGVTSEAESEQFISEFLLNNSVTLPLSLEDTNPAPEMSPPTNERSTEELLAAIPIAHLGKDQQGQVLSLFSKYSDLLQRHKYHFSVNPEYTARLDMKPIPQPIIQKQIPLPPQAAPEVTKILEAMLKAGVIEECNEATPILSSLLITKKKDKGIRILLDSRTANQYTYRKHMRPIVLDEIFNALGGAKYVVSCDLANAYFQLKLRKTDRKYLAFRNPVSSRVYRYRCLPQGAINSAAFLQEAMADVLDGYHQFALIYMDDLLVYSNISFEDLMQKLEKIFVRFRRFKMLMKPEKIQICPPLLEFLGIAFKVGKFTTAHIPEWRIRGYRDQAIPKTKKALLSFLASVSYFRRFIPHYSDRVRLMTQASLPGKTGKPSDKVDWSPQLKQEYADLLVAINEHSTIQCPKTDRPFVAFSDASEHCASFLLMQPDEHNKLKLVAAISRIFPKSQAHAHIYSKELVSLTTGIESLQYYLRFCTGLHVFTDSKGLALAALTKYSNPYLTRKLMFLSQFPIKITHVSSLGNVLSDHLSRYHRFNPKEKEEPRQLLSPGDACKLLEAVRFDDIQFSSDDVERMLKSCSPIPAPTSKQRSSSSFRASAPRQMDTSKLAPRALPTRKIRQPRTYVNRSLSPSHRPYASSSPSFSPAPIPEKKETFSSYQTEADQDYAKLMLGNRYEFTPEQWEQKCQTLLSDCSEPPIQCNHVNISVSPPDNKFNCLLPSSEFISQNPKVLPRVLSLQSLDKPRLMTSDDCFFLPPISIYSAKVTPAPFPPKPEEKVINSVLHPSSLSFCCPDNENDKDCEHSTTPSSFYAISTIPHRNAISPSDFVTCQRNDPYISGRMDYFMDHPQAPFCYVDGIFCHKSQSGAKKVLLPKILLPHLTTMYHYQFGNHSSVNKIYNTVAHRYFRPHLKADIAKLVKDCALCTVCQPLSKSYLQGAFEQPTEPRTKYGIDFIPSLSPVDGFRNILVVVDYASGVVRLFPTKDRKAADIINALRMVQMFDCTSIPFLRSDGEPALSSKEFLSFVEENGIFFEQTAAFNPQANGRCERMVGEVKKGLFHLAKSFPDSWPYFLPAICLSHNKLVSSSLNISPELYHFGSETPHPSSLLYFEAPFSLQRIIDTRKEANSRRVAKQEKQRAVESGAQTQRRLAYAPGMLVETLTTKAKRGGPFEAVFHGPYLIKAVKKNGYSVELESLCGKFIRRKVSMRHIKLAPGKYGHLIQSPTQLPSVSEST